MRSQCMMRSRWTWSLPTTGTLFSGGQAAAAAHDRGQREGVSAHVLTGLADLRAPVAEGDRDRARLLPLLDEHGQLDLGDTGLERDDVARVQPQVGGRLRRDGGDVAP